MPYCPCIIQAGRIQDIFPYDIKVWGSAFLALIPKIASFYFIAAFNFLSLISSILQSILLPKLTTQRLMAVM